MENFESKYAKNQARAKEEADKSNATLSYRIKGLTGGTLIMFIYTYFYVGESSPKMLIAGGVLGYFLGWVAGNFFYTKK